MITRRRFLARLASAGALLPLARGRPDAPQKILTEHTDWRMFDALKKELKA